MFVNNYFAFFQAPEMKGETLKRRERQRQEYGLEKLTQDQVKHCTGADFSFTIIIFGQNHDH